MSTSNEEDGFIDQVEFVKEAEADAYAEAVIAQGYNAEVYQNVYDYMWCVDVYAQQQQVRAA